MEWWAVLLPWINAQAAFTAWEVDEMERWGKIRKKLKKPREFLFFFRKTGVIIAATCSSCYCSIGNHLVFQEFAGWWSITRSTKFIVLGWAVSVFCVSWMSWDWASAHLPVFLFCRFEEASLIFINLKLKLWKKQLGQHSCLKKIHGFSSWLAFLLYLFLSIFFFAEKS